MNASNGAVAQSIDYDAYGRVLNETGAGFQPFGFAGGLYDADTKLVRFGARDYDPGMGRFTNKDPIGFAGQQGNQYLYVDGEPVNRVDPSGLRPLTANEKAFLIGFFGSALDVNVIDIGSSISNRSWTPYGNRISLAGRNFFAGDSDNETFLLSLESRLTLLHEALHVWERQHGAWVTIPATPQQIVATLGLIDPYEYDKNANVYLQFLSGGVEQRAQIFEDCARSILTAAGKSSQECRKTFWYVQHLKYGR